MRKFIAIAVAMITTLMVFTSCADTETDAEHIHTWYDATCTEPRTCSVCGHVTEQMTAKAEHTPGNGS